MNETFLDTDEDLIKVLKANKYDSSLVKAGMKTAFMHPTLVQTKLFELSETKNEIILKSQTATGKSFGAITALVNKLVKSIKDSAEGERNHIVILCPNKAVAQKNVKTLDSVLLFAKGEYGLQTINLTEFHFDLLTNEEYLDQKRKLILVGTPTQYKKFLMAIPNYAAFLASNRGTFVDELNYMLAFGYKSDLEDVFLHLRKNVSEPFVIVSISQEGDERLPELRKALLQRPVTIKFDEKDLEEIKEEKEAVQKSGLANEYFYIGDEMAKFMALYFIMKLKFIAGKTLILCSDVNQAYKAYAFLERSEINVAKVYNPEWPLNIRNYLLSVYNSGIVNILVAPLEILQDSEKARGKYKSNHQLRNITNIVLFDFDACHEHYSDLARYLGFTGAVPCIISLLDNSDLDKDKLFNLVESERETHGKAIITQLPVKQGEIENFRYRVSDVVRSITRKQIAKMKQIDFKKQLIKSKKLKGYFDEHKQERDMIVKDIEKSAQMVSKYAVKLNSTVPLYLLPEEMRKKIEEKEAQEGPKTVRVAKQELNEEFSKSLEKRLKNNNLTMDDVKKKIKVDTNKYINVREDLEDPTITDESRLTILSSRKLWKLKHKKKLKSRNRRLEKKGIFDPSTL